jgi:hypothetical protein
VRTALADDRAVTTPFRIRITDPTLHWDLLRSLSEGDCLAVALPDGTFEVIHRHARNDREARLELSFFVRAWQTKHPHAAAELVG